MLMLKTECLLNLSILWSLLKDKMPPNLGTKFINPGQRYRFVISHCPVQDPVKLYSCLKDSLYPPGANGL